MKRETFIKKINYQEGGANEMDIFHLICIYSDLFGYTERIEKLSLEDQYIYMWDKVLNYKPELSKVCRKCNMEKSIELYRVTKVRGKDYTNSECNDCYNEYQKVMSRKSKDNKK